MSHSSGSNQKDGILVEAFQTDNRLFGRIFLNERAASSSAVLLFVHGGPGFAAANWNDDFFASTLLTTNARACVVWDQRGCGRSFSLARLVRSWTIGMFVDEVLYLAEWTSVRFPSSGIVLIAHSWGTIPGVLAAQRRPSLFSAYISLSQVVDGLSGERFSYEAALRNGASEQRPGAARLLRWLGPPPHPKVLLLFYLIAQRSLIGAKPTEMKGSQPLRLEESPRRSSNRKRRTVILYQLGFALSVLKLWKQCLEVNLIAAVPALEVPTFFFAGEQDLITPPHLIEEFYRRLDCHPKRYYLLKTGHRPHLDDPSTFLTAIRDTIHAAASRKESESALRGISSKLF